METRDYRRKRYALVEALNDVKTHDSVQGQLDHLLDMIRLCRSDNMGVRDLVPALMLRLDKDQECYDFVKWYKLQDLESEYDWGETDLPFLDLKNANVFESVELFKGQFIDLAHTAALMLLKIKLRSDLKSLQDSALVGENIPREILDRIQTHIPRSPIIANNKEIMERGSHRKAILELEEQVDELYELIDEHNSQFWLGLLEPHRHLAARPEAYSSGSIEEMQIMLKYSYDSWAETPGAIENIRARIDPESSEDE